MKPKTLVTNHLKESEVARESTEENENHHPRQDDDIGTLEEELADSGDAEF